jgi:hypothetical protein
MTKETNQPIEVNGMVLPAMLAAAVRYAIALALPWLVSKGYITEESTEGFLTYGLVAATVAYGLWKTYKAKAQLVVTAEAAPNSVAIVK